MPPTSKTPLAAQARCSSSFGRASLHVPQNRPPQEPPSSLFRTAPVRFAQYSSACKSEDKLPPHSRDVVRCREAGWGPTRERKGDEKGTNDGLLGQRPAFPFRRPGKEHGAERRPNTAQTMPTSLNYSAVAAEAVAGTVPGHTSTHARAR